MDELIKILGKALQADGCRLYDVLKAYLQAKRLEVAEILDSRANTTEKLWIANGQRVMLNEIEANFSVILEKYQKATSAPEGQ